MFLKLKPSLHISKAPASTYVIFFTFFRISKQKTCLKQLFLPPFLFVSRAFFLFFSAFLQQFNSFSHTYPNYRVFHNVSRETLFVLFSTLASKTILALSSLYVLLSSYTTIFLLLFVLNSSLFNTFYSFFINVSRETLVFFCFFVDFGHFFLFLCSICGFSS